ncbi:carbohydrate ABC transporter permease [Paenibacillus spongiae]|uniref:Sugar ABC transporter permease n=1 Tax=Paenibacillus spongiae TaxID=2909671 RepID=A0ABY5S5I5_9BACL|nr:sugar ABC transporter permease [Paenibacillus spongiae]UVI29166.1 sugar ABC transporter permease [Paenibacillus spongiae]
MNKKWTTRAWIFAFLAPTILVFLLFNLVPIITVFVTGFTDWNGFSAPVWAGLDNYINLVSYDDTFLISLRNLGLWSLIAGTVHVGFGVLVAFILYKRPFGWRLVRGVFMIPNVISVAAWAIMYKFIFNDDIGVINNFMRDIGFSNWHVKWFYESPAAFIAVTLTWLFYSVIVTLIVLNELMAIPKEVHEAALLDGANEWQVTRFINLPLVRNAIGTGVILSITARIAMFEEVALTSRGGPGNDTYNIPLMLYNGIVNSEYGYANAAGTVMILLGVIVMLGVNRLFRMNEKIY